MPILVCQHSNCRGTESYQGHHGYIKIPFHMQSTCNKTNSQIAAFMIDPCFRHLLWRKRFKSLFCLLIAILLTIGAFQHINYNNITCRGRQKQIGSRTSKLCVRVRQTLNQMIQFYFQVGSPGYDHTFFNSLYLFHAICTQSFPFPRVILGAPKMG